MTHDVTSDHELPEGRLWASKMGRNGFFYLMSVYFFVLVSLFDLLFVPGAFGHGAWWLFAALLAKAAVSMALASIVLVVKRRWPLALVSAVLIVWMAVNGMYYHATGLYVTFDVVKMAGGLNGFGSSVWTYLRWDVVLVLAVGLLIVPIFRLQRQAALSWHSFFKVWAVICLCSLSGGVFHYLYDTKHEKLVKSFSGDYFRLFDFYGDCKPKAWRDGENWYIERHSIAMALPHLFVHAYHLGLEEESNAFIAFSDEEADFLDRGPADTSSALGGHLVVILVESLENWALEQKDAGGNDVMPCLNAFIGSRPTLVARRVVCQKRYGESGDGQLIINSGLLPVKEGVACMKYSNRTYPNFAHLFPQSAIVNPVKNAWNQTVMTGRYGYRQLLEPDGITMKETWNDAQVVDVLRNVCDTIERPACIMALTISSHTPFDRVAPGLRLPNGLSRDRASYLNCIHYADSCVGLFLRWADTARCMRNATVVITGDHNIFPDEVCPLVVSSPSISESLLIEEVCYQMDIYPTILHAIGQRGYFWKGFGVDLLDDESRDRRPISVEAAFELSDKLIRKDYFGGKGLGKD